MRVYRTYMHHKVSLTWRVGSHFISMLNLVFIFCRLKSNICNFTLRIRPPSHHHRFLQVLSHFRGFEPHQRRYFFLKSDIKWAFSSLESYVINLNGQNNHKTQKNIQEMCKIAIAIYLCSIHFKKVKYWILVNKQTWCSG